MLAWLTCLIKYHLQLIISQPAKRSKASRLPEISYELLQMIVNQKSLHLPSAHQMVRDTAERIKKMKRMEALNKKLMNSEAKEESFPVAVSKCKCF